MVKEKSLVKTEDNLIEPTQKNSLEELIEKARVKESAKVDEKSPETDAAGKEKLEALKKEIEREEQGYQAVYNKNSEAWKRVEAYFGNNIKPVDLEKSQDIVFCKEHLEEAKQKYEKALSGNSNEKTESQKNIPAINLNENNKEAKEEKSPEAILNEKKIEKNDEEGENLKEEPVIIIESLKNAKNNTELLRSIVEFISSGNFKLWKHLRSHESLENILSDAEIPDAVKDNINELPEIIAKEKGVAAVSADQSGSIKDYLRKLVNLWNQEK